MILQTVLSSNCEVMFWNNTSFGLKPSSISPFFDPAALLPNSHADCAICGQEFYQWCENALRIWGEIMWLAFWRRHEGGGRDMKRTRCFICFFSKLIVQKCHSRCYRERVPLYCGAASVVLWVILFTGCFFFFNNSVFKQFKCHPSN